MTERFKIISNHGQVSYLYHDKDGWWKRASPGGTQLSIADTVAGHDEMALRFRLEDATTSDERLRLIQKAVGVYGKVEVFK